MIYPLVSIVIPVFNVEKYLSECLDSVISQNYDNLEIICVNDGSTDNSYRILERYQKGDQRIVLINQNNLGLAAARNTGLRFANGSFVMFVDSDDWIEKNAVTAVYRAFDDDDVDIVCYGAMYRYEDKHEPDKIAMRYKYDVKKKPEGGWITKVSITAWAKMYRTDFLRRNKLEFQDGLYYEDNPFFWECVSSAKKIALSKEILYNYRIRSNSIMSNSKKKIMGMAIHYIYGLNAIYDRWVANGYLRKNRLLFQWLFEDYVRLGYQCLNENDKGPYIAAIKKCLEKWKGNVYLRKGTLLYDLITGGSTDGRWKYRLTRSFYRRQLAVYGIFYKMVRGD